MPHVHLVQRLEFGRFVGGRDFGGLGGDIGRWVLDYMALEDGGKRLLIVMPKENIAGSKSRVRCKGTHKSRGAKGKMHARGIGFFFPK